MRDNLILVQEEPRGPSQLIEIPVNVNGLQRVQFPDVQQLRSMVNQRIIVKQMRLIPDAVLTRGPVIGNVNAVVTELQKLTMVIYCEGWEKAQFIPILVLNDFQAPGTTLPNRFRETRFNNWQNIDWNKSYLQFANGTVSAGAPYEVMIDVCYIKLDATDNEIVGPS